MEDKIYQLARRRVAEKRGFYRHFSVYLTVGASFFIMNTLTFYESYQWWFFLPMIPWSTALFIHYFSVFGLPGGQLSMEWEERELRREMDRLRIRAGQLERRQRDDRLELRSLPEKESRQSRKNWRDEDLV